MPKDKIEFDRLLNTMQDPDPYEQMVKHIIAINVAWSLNSNETLYQTVLQRRVAEAVWALDDRLANRYLGVIKVPQIGAPVYHRVEQAIAPLRYMSRGSWAVFELDGKYDAYMADGDGGVSTETGHKFFYTKPMAPNLNFLTQYGAILGWSTYNLRREIERDIIAMSVDEAGIKAGTVITDCYLQGKTYNKVVTDANVVNGEVTVTASRRGARKVQFKFGAEAIFRTFGDHIKVVIPDKYLTGALLERFAALPPSQDRYLADIIPGRFMEFATTHLEPAMVERWNAEHGIVTPQPSVADMSDGVTQIVIKLGGKHDQDPVPTPNQMSASEMEIITREIVSQQLQLMPTNPSYFPADPVIQKVLAEFRRIPAYQDEVVMRAAAMLKSVYMIMQRSGSPLKPVEGLQMAAPEEDLPSHG